MPGSAQGVVELIAAREAAYLEHCRNFALSQAKTNLSSNFVS
jgi:hypothetical protein